MKDKEIIKALECCNHNHTWQKQCFDCEYATFENNCGNELIKDSLNLINKQKAEIEKLRERNTFGEWKINCDGYYPYCSECGKEPSGRTMTDYCPCCGAKMEGKI